MRIQQIRGSEQKQFADAYITAEAPQLVINTGTTIVTFLMVFLIQNTQNRDGIALQTKLDELVRSSKAENEFMGIEKLTDKDSTSFTRAAKLQQKKHDALLAKTKAAREARRKR